MVSAYYAHTPAFSIPADDEALRANAIGVIRNVFPECASDVMFVHVIRWPAGIAQFPAGRLTEMVTLRSKLAGWDAPIDFCGDYLDGVSSEGALCTGEQAAERVMTRVAH
jgi:protoporphyrinogen oxidase